MSSDTQFHVPRASPYTLFLRKNCHLNYQTAWVPLGADTSSITWGRGLPGGVRCVTRRAPRTLKMRAPEPKSRIKTFSPSLVVSVLTRHDGFYVLFRTISLVQGGQSRGGGIRSQYVGPSPTTTHA